MVAQPTKFEQWVTFSLKNLILWFEKRAADSQMFVQIVKITLEDNTIPINKTILSQIANQHLFEQKK